jgi:hypothetical protein
LSAGVGDNSELAQILKPWCRGYADEVWLFGDRISSGMKQEIGLALSLGIPVIPKTEETAKDFQEFRK